MPEQILSQYTDTKMAIIQHYRANLVNSFGVVEYGVALVAGGHGLDPAHDAPPHTVVKVWVCDGGGHELREGGYDDGVSLLVKDGDRSTRYTVTHGNGRLIPAVKRFKHQLGPLTMQKYSF